MSSVSVEQQVAEENIRASKLHGGEVRMLFGTYIDVRPGCRRKNKHLAEMYHRNGDCRRSGTVDRRSA